MSASKFFRNFMLVPQMRSTDSSCNQTREERHQNNDMEMKRTRVAECKKELQSPLRIDRSSDQHQKKVSEDAPTTDLNQTLNEDLHLNLRMIDAATTRDADRNIDGAEENKVEQIVTMASNGPSCLSGTEKETKNDSTAEHGQSTLTNTQIHTKGDSRGSVCGNVEQLDVLLVGNDRLDVERLTENQSEKIKETLIEISRESASDDECVSIASSSNAASYEEADCQDMEIEEEEETEEAIIDLAASCDVHFQSSSQTKSDKTKEQRNQVMSMNNPTAPVDQLSVSSHQDKSNNLPFQLVDSETQEVLNSTMESGSSAATNSFSPLTNLLKSNLEGTSGNMVFFDSAAIRCLSKSNVAMIVRSNITNAKSNQNGSKDNSSIVVKKNRSSFAAGVVYEDEVSSPEGPQSPTVTQTLLSSNHSDAVSLSYSRLSDIDRGTSSTFCSRIESMVSSKLPTGSTLLSNKGVYRIKDKEKPFACGFCGKAYKRKSAAYCHILYYHGEKRFACEFCGKRYTAPSHLAAHVRIHTLEKPFTCDQCGMQFRFVSSFRRHKLFTHSKERPFHCNQCNKAFKSSRGLSKHKESHTKDERRKGVTCDVCKRRFGKPFYLKEHMRIHTGEKPFKCSLCEKQFRLKAYLRDHMNIHQDTKKRAGKQESVCANLDFVSHIMSTDMRFHSGEKPHMMIRSGETPLGGSPLEEQIQLKTGLQNHLISSNDAQISGISRSSNVCNEDVADCEVAIVGESRIQNTTETIPRQDHTKDHSSNSVIGKRVSVEAVVVNDSDVFSPEGSQSPSVTQTLFSSDHSDAVSLSFSRLSDIDRGTSSTFCSRIESVVSSKLPTGSTLLSNRGVYRIKDKERPFACGFCGKAYRRKKAVYCHITLQHGEKRFSCEFCGKRFAQPSDLASHVRIHTLEKPFTCDQCGKQFRQVSNLRKHKYTHSKERLFHCDQCNKSYKTKDGLSVHRESHKEEEQKKGVTCDICKMKFRMPSLLKDHMMIHTGEKSFKCTLCDKQFRKKLMLHSHMNSHSGKKKLAKDPCSICGKTLWAARMPDHMRMHAGVKPYECNICGKRFPKKPNLEGHIRSHTGEKPFACIGCDKRFALYSNMVTHKAKCKALTENVS